MDSTMIRKIVSLHQQPGDPEFVLDSGPDAKPMGVQYKDWIAAVAADRMSRGVDPGVVYTPAPDPQFLPPKITGYRQLTEAEVALMNEAKALAEKCGALVARLRQHPDSMQTNKASAFGDAPLDQRWISMGASDLQVGFMKLIRGIAQPTSF